MCSRNCRDTVNQSSYVETEYNIIIYKHTYIGRLIACAIKKYHKFHMYTSIAPTYLKFGRDICKHTYAKDNPF